MLVRAAERFDAGGVGIDTDADALAAARSAADARAPGAGLSFVRGDAAQFLPRPENVGAFDVAACVGSAHACGGYVAALRSLRQAVRPGGLVLVGEIYWRRDPPAEYLAVLGQPASDYRDHAGRPRPGPTRD